MMAQREMDRSIQELLGTTERILRAYGYQIVTGDDQLFPSAKPDLAALKNGRLLVGLAKVYGATDRFLNPDEVNYIRDQLDMLVDADRPYKDNRVKTVDKIALVLVPGDITIASPVGDIKWVVVEDVNELPEEMDKVLGGKA